MQLTNTKLAAYETDYDPIYGDIYGTGFVFYGEDELADTEENDDLSNDWQNGPFAEC